MSDKKTYFVLMKVGYEYNDETYFPSSRGNGKPSNIFCSKLEAEKAAKNKNREEFKTLIQTSDIKEYGYSISEVLDYEKSKTKSGMDKVNNIFKNIFGLDAESWWDESRPKMKYNVSNEELDELISCFSFTFYNVIEVEEG